ncbi:hypothetical protein LXL04_021420 [Taraxacum kok-saghyz]
MARVKGWKTLEEKLLKRLSVWKVSSLPIGGRSLLIKSVLGALGVYFFSLFVMPVVVAKKFEAYRARFFWGSTENSRGLDFGSLASFNLALVLKWKWWFFTSEDTVWTKVIRFLYGSTGGFFRERISASGLSPWERILAAEAKLREKDIIKEEVLEKVLGDGKNTRFWTDVWVGERSLAARFPRLMRRDSAPDCLVADRWSAQEWQFSWSRPITGGVAAGQFKVLVELLQVVRCSDARDSWRWKLDVDGRFSSNHFKTRWCKFIPRKVNIFIWRVSWRRLPTRVALKAKGVDLDSVDCPICGDGEEDLQHLFFRCSVASALWCRIFRWLEVQPYEGADPVEVLRWCDKSRMGANARLVLEVVCSSTLWVIWRYRNDVVHETGSLRICLLFDYIREISYLWFSSRNIKSIIKALTSLRSCPSQSIHSRSIRVPSMANKYTQITAATHLTTKLTPHNYPVWRRQVEATLISLELEDFIIGSSNQPPKEVKDKDGKSISNPEYLLWYRKDQMILSALLGSCSESIQPLISSAPTARQAWERLNSSFASSSRSRIISLKSRLTKNPKGNRSITEFLQEMRSIADALALAQSPVSEEDLMVYILSQLGDDYNTIAAATKQTTPLDNKGLTIAIQPLATTTIGHTTQAHNVVDITLNPKDPEQTHMVIATTELTNFANTVTFQVTLHEFCQYCNVNI